MKSEVFGKWYGEHYNELYAVALRRLDGNHHDAEDAVQTAAAWACDTGDGEYKGKTRFESFILTRKKNSTTKFAVWPQMAQAVGQAAHNLRVSRDRATAAQSEGGAALQDEKGNRGRRTPVPLREDDQRAQENPALIGKRGSGDLPSSEPEAVKPAAPGTFDGPTGWAGEFNVHHLGPCKCRMPQTTRVERGKDVDRRKVNSALSGRLLSLLHHGVKDAPEGSIDRLAAYLVGCLVTGATRGETEWFTHQVIGCWGGHRTYLGEFGFNNFQREKVTTMPAPRFFVLYTDGSIALHPSSTQCSVSDLLDRKPWSGGPHEHAKFSERRHCAACRVESTNGHGVGCRHGLRPVECSHCAPPRVIA